MDALCGWLAGCPVMSLSRLLVVEPGELTCSLMLTHTYICGWWPSDADPLTHRAWTTESYMNGIRDFILFLPQHAASFRLCLLHTIWPYRAPRILHPIQHQAALLLQDLVDWSVLPHLQAVSLSLLCHPLAGASKAPGESTSCCMSVD